jgi:hypothetical protein
MNSLQHLSDTELTGRLRQLVRHERNLTLSILPHIAEVGRRQLYLQKAYSTLTEYCIHELGYGDSSASRRVRAARVIKDIPEVYDLLKDGRVTLSAVVQVSGLLSPDNKDTLLPRLVGQSRTEIERIMAEYVPPRRINDQAKPTLVKKRVAVERAPTARDEDAPPGAPPGEVGEMTRHSDGSKDPTVNMSTRDVKEVLERMYELRFAADEELMELIRWMKCHLSHRYPTGASYLEIFKHAMKYYKKREDLALQKTPRGSSVNTDSRYIPKAIKQKVWKRDQGRCTFVGSNGKRCNSDYLIQFDHYPVPFARGGPSTVDNLRLLCARHNRHTAKITYGEQCINKHTIKEAPVAYSVSYRRSFASRSLFDLAPSVRAGPVVQ